MTFLIFEKGYKQKIVLNVLRFCKYAFFKYLKEGISKKIVLFKICKYAFLIFKKEYKQKIVLGF